METNTNPKKWLWPVVIGALAAVVLLAVALNYAIIPISLFIVLSVFQKSGAKVRCFFRIRNN